jgi:hypothetical protein
MGTEVSTCLHCTLALRLLLAVREALLKTLTVVSRGLVTVVTMITDFGSAASVAPTSQARVPTMLLLLIVIN